MMPLGHAGGSGGFVQNARVSKTLFWTVSEGPASLTLPDFRALGLCRRQAEVGGIRRTAGKQFCAGAVEFALRHQHDDFRQVVSHLESGKWERDLVTGY